MKKATITGCKRLSVRFAPWEIEEEEDYIVDYLANGDTVSYDPNDATYDWTGRRYLKVKLAGGAEGFVPEFALKPNEV